MFSLSGIRAATKDPGGSCSEMHGVIPVLPYGLGGKASENVAAANVTELRVKSFPRNFVGPPNSKPVRHRAVAGVRSLQSELRITGEPQERNGMPHRGCREGAELARPASKPREPDCGPLLFFPGAVSDPTLAGYVIKVRVLVQATDAHVGACW